MQRRSKLRPVVAAALAVVFAILPLAALAYEPGHFYVIQSKVDGRVLTAEGDAALLGSERHQAAPVAMRTATGAKNQLWYVERAPGWHGHLGLHYIRNYVGGRVLHLQGGQPTNAITYPRDASPGINQVWYFNGASIQTYAGNDEWKCLDVLYANWRYGPNVGSWSCNGNANQQWQWVRKDRIVPVGDVAGRATVAYAGEKRFVRPLTPQEADAHGIPGPRGYNGFPGSLPPYVLHARQTGADVCSRIVSGGLANWRLPTRAEFSQLLTAYRPSSTSKLGEGLTRLGWGNAQYWSGDVHPARPSLFLWMWPNNPAEDLYLEAGTGGLNDALITCVR